MERREPPLQRKLSGPSENVPWIRSLGNSEGIRVEITRQSTREEEMNRRESLETISLEIPWNGSR